MTEEAWEVKKAEELIERAREHDRKRKTLCDGARGLIQSISLRRGFLEEASKEDEEKMERISDLLEKNKDVCKLEGSWALED